MLQTFAAIVTALLVVGAARASPYWIDYEGASGQFPEEQGWQRITNGGGANRWFDADWFVIDSSSSPHITDYYAWHMYGGMDPGPGEEFIARWRIRIDDVLDDYDPGVSVSSDGGWTVAFVMGQDTIKSVYENNVTAAFEAGVAHTFEFRSSDMRAYALSIDGMPAIEGSFWFSLSGASRVMWGDVVNGDASLSRWNYYEFGVVPECGNLVSAGVVAALVSLIQRRTWK